jgi:hypothetical protein
VRSWMSVSSLSVLFIVMETSAAHAIATSGGKTTSRASGRSGGTTGAGAASRRLQTGSGKGSPRSLTARTPKQQPSRLRFQARQEAGYGKDESSDLNETQRGQYHAWQARVKQTMVTESGEHLQVAVVEVGPPGVPKETLVHLHGATVQPENILLWRMAKAAEADGRPIRIIAPTDGQAEKVLDEAYREYGEVLLSGHSMGSVQGAGLAGRHPDKVKGFIGFGSPAAPSGKVPTLLVQGENDGPAAARSLAAGNPHVTALILRGVDHSLRLAPANSGPGAEKARYNATP